MSHWKSIALIAVTTCFVSVVSGAPAAPRTGAPAQVSVQIGVEPGCPYGYFDYAPYDCAPYGYYGPDWFTGGVFIGAGPWFHGGHGFYGHVDNRYDPHRCGVPPLRCAPWPRLRRWAAAHGTSLLHEFRSVEIRRRQTSVIDCSSRR